MLIDHYLPDADVRALHSTSVAAPPDRVDAAVLGMDLGASGVTRLLFTARGMPPTALRWSGLERLGFRRLEHRPGEEFVVGLIGRFWSLRGGLRRFEPEEFRAFHEPGWAQAVWGFRMEGLPDGTTLLTTETRVHCTDPGSRARFRVYWSVIRPFSGLIRREALRVIRRQAERG